MKEQFVTYEIAVQLKKLKFDRPCLAAFEDFTCDKKLVIATQIQIELFGGYTVKSLYRDVAANNDVNLPPRLLLLLELGAV
jgi:hypothetical protein